MDQQLKDEHHYPGTRDFISLLQKLSQLEQVQEHPEWKDAHTLIRLEGGAACHMVLCRWTEPVVVSRAPGRMDVMGGIADYSGSLVLQMPLQEACFCALQLSTAPADGYVRVVSLGAQERDHAYQVSMAALYPDGKPLPYDNARQLFQERPESTWVGYVLGCLLVLSHELGTTFTGCSVSILLSSSVPEGKGVSSSASVEVAVMSALSGALSLHEQLPGRRVAVLCQMVENLVVGAPCGIMDQMASALGEQHQLLALLCQPAEVQGCVTIPEHLQVWGIDSGVRHSVGGSDYASVRVGAFMGHKIINHLQAQRRQDTASSNAPAAQQGPSAQRGTRSADSCKDSSTGATDRGMVLPAATVQHLCQLSPSHYQDCLQDVLPVSIKGEEFLTTYGDHLDNITSIQPEAVYAVRQPTAHPIHEHTRVQLFRQLLQAPPSTEQCMLLGELMFQSHASYSACKLGSAGTDRLVQLVREHIEAATVAGQAPLLYGAKITGGGCGGTVCVLGAATHEADQAVRNIAAQYWAEQNMTGAVKVFSGSSGGATSFDHMLVHVGKRRQ